MQPYIVCPDCGKVSHNPNDIRERYCGWCHRFHDEMPNARHAHTFIVQGEESYAPTGPPPEHTKFFICKCECGAVSVFPFANWELTTEDYKTKFLSQLYRRGWYLVPDQFIS